MESARLGLAAETDVVAEVQTIAAVLLADGACLESRVTSVLGDPDLIVAVGEVGGVDELQVVGEFLADREARARVGFVGDERGLDSDFAEPGCLLKSAAESGADAAGQDTRAPARGRPRTLRRASRRAFAR